MRFAMILGLVAALAGCGGGGDATSTGGADPHDAGADAVIDAAVDAGPPPDCSGGGAWQPAAMLDVGRYAPGAAVLPDGRVLVAGGWDATKKISTKTAFFFDPASGTMDAASPLSRAINFPAVAPIDGGLLFAGGFNDLTGSEKRSDVFHVADGTFTKSGQMIETRELFSATTLPDGRVLVLGGLSAIGLKVRATAEIYDPVAGTFAAAGTLLHARFGQASLWVPAVAKVLIVGGKTIGPNGDEPVPEAEWFDAASGMFSPAGALAHGRDRATADLLADGHVLVAGGSNAAEGSLASTEVFDPATSTFTPGPAMSTRRMAHTSTALADGRLVMIGGWSDSSSPSASTTSVEIFDPEAMAFAPLPPLAEPRHDHVAPRAGACGVLVVGGIHAVQGGSSTTPLAIERIDLAKP